ncbi:hypothetical protein Tco_0327618 [Tanacetum coccineum]
MKGIQTLTVEEQLAADTIQALKASRKSSKIQPHVGGSSEGTGASPGVPDESTVILTTSSEGTGTKPGVPDEVKGASKAKAEYILDWGSEEESEYFEEETLAKRLSDLERRCTMKLKQRRSLEGAPETHYVVNDADQPQDDLEPKTDSAPKHDWFKQPPRPPTPDPEWNKCQIIDDQPGQPCLIDPNIKATPIDFSNFAKNYLKLDKITKADLVGPVYNLLKGTFQSDRCPFDFSKLLPLKVHIGRLTVALEYFFNNDLECFKSIDSERKYTTSITKTKAARFSKHNVFSHQKILSVVSMKVKKLHGYGYLEEIMVRRADRQMYKFKEGNFVNLHINDIEDMLLLVVQHKLFHLDCEVIVDLALALHMLTRNPIIKKRVEDIQLGVESYQKKLNITKPKKDFPGISAKEPYTPLFELLGVVYEELSHQKRLMRADELYKFSDGTLEKVRDTLQHRLRNF